MLQTRECGSRDTTRTMVYKPFREAEGDGRSSGSKLRNVCWRPFPRTHGVESGSSPFSRSTTMHPNPSDPTIDRASSGNSITLFSWGYWGWGNATDKQVKAIDAVETNRGYKEPLFVDTRISRSVRAKGFTGDAFKQTVGESRYRWMPDLGNERVLQNAGPAIQIKNPKAAKDLLCLAEKIAEEKRRLIFFCSCLYPYREDDPHACHRVTIARLLLEAAGQRQTPIDVVEWPGGSPVDIMISKKKFARALLNKRKSIPLGARLPVARRLGLPWGSLVRVTSGKNPIFVVSGPARYGYVGNGRSWFLPVPWEPAGTNVEELKRTAKTRRREYGLEVRSTA